MLQHAHDKSRLGRELARERGIPTQEFSVRSDMACGSTIGAASTLPRTPHLELLPLGQIRLRPGTEQADSGSGLSKSADRSLLATRGHSHLRLSQAPSWPPVWAAGCSTWARHSWRCTPSARCAARRTSRTPMSTSVHFSSGSRTLMRCYRWMTCRRQLFRAP